MEELKNAKEVEIEIEDYDEEKFLSPMFKEYRKLFPKSEAIPMMELMGDEILWGKFKGSQDAVYEYCIEHRKTWEEVLNFKFDPNAMY